MDRRNFAKNIGLTLGGIVISQSIPKIAQGDTCKCKNKYNKPKRLKVGDTIGLVAPASTFSKETYEKAKKNITELGFKIVEGKNLHKTYGSFAGTDKERADDINTMFADESIDGIWCLRGGYGTARIFPYLDFKKIKKNPKALIGYSDITALNQALHYQSRLVGFHGPVAASNFTPYTKQSFIDVVMEGKTPTYHLSEENQEKAKEDQSYESYVITPGRATGHLLGGNLSLLSSLAGTDFEMYVDGQLIFIEDIGEKPYRVDRMLTQLLQNKDLSGAAGIILGVFNDCQNKEGSNDLSLKEVLKDRLGNLGIPVMYGFSFGHIDNQVTLPLGIKATMDTSSMTLSIDESAVI